MSGIARVPVMQQVVDNMKNYISSDAVEPGQKLPTEKEWCEKLDVGRGTVREAFRVLEAKGLIEIRPGRGAFVSDIKAFDQDEIVQWFADNNVELKDYIDVRSAVEPLVAKLLAARGMEDGIGELESIHERFIRAVRENDILAMARNDEKLHRCMVEYTGNGMLIFINKKIDECLWDFRIRTFQVPRNAQNAIKAHQNIVDAIKERDPEVAELYAKRHIHLINVDMNVILNK